MEAIRYAAPASLADAVQLLEGATPGHAWILAGGTDLLVQMRIGRIDPGLIVDIKHIPEIGQVTRERDDFVIGAAVSGAELRETPEFAVLFPGLAEATDLIGSEQIQGRASLGGNLCNASPAADTVPALVALGARARIVGPDGTRTVPVAEFVTSPGHNVLEAGELLVALLVPVPAPRSADAYLRLIPRTEMDIAVVGAGVSLTLDSDGRCAAARLALGAVAPTVIEVPDAVDAMVGSTLDDAALSAAAAAATAACNPIDDMRGTVTYRRHVAGVLTRRAILRAAERAREQN